MHNIVFLKYYKTFCLIFAHLNKLNHHISIVSKGRRVCQTQFSKKTTTASPGLIWFIRFRGDGLIVKRLRRMMNDRRLNEMKF